MPSKNCVFTYMVTSRKNKNKKKKVLHDIKAWNVKFHSSGQQNKSQKKLLRDWKRLSKGRIGCFWIFLYQIVIKVVKKWWCHKFPSKIHEREWYLIKTKEKVGWHVGPMEMECLFLILIYQSVPEFVRRKNCTWKSK